MLSETLSPDRTKQNGQWISILFLGEQEPSLSPVLISKDIGNDQTQTSVVENDPWASKLGLLITKGDLTMTQHSITLSMSNPAIFTQHSVIQNSVAQFPCQSTFHVGRLSSLSIISRFYEQLCCWTSRTPFAYLHKLRACHWLYFILSTSLVTV